MSRGFQLVKDKHSNEWISHQGFPLARFDRNHLSLYEVRFRPKGLPLLSHVPLAWTIFMGKEKDITVESFSQDPDEFRLNISYRNQKGNLSGKTVLLLSFEREFNSYIYSIETSLRVEKSCSLKRDKQDWQGYTNWFDKCKGTRFAGTGVWYMQYGDPAPYMGVGPATPITRDRPEILYPMPHFHRNWRKRWKMCIYQDPHGKYISVPHNHLLSSDKDLWEMKKNGIVGWFNESEGNPVIRFLVDTGQRTVCHLCQWAYDIHLWYVLDIDETNPVLERGTELKASYEILSYDRKHSSSILRRAKMVSSSPEDRILYDLPAYRAGVNTFRQGIKEIDESWYWSPGGRAVWDHSQGHNDSHSLKIENDMTECTRWYTMVGRSYFMDPLIEGIRYKLSAWVKTSWVKGAGARIGISQARVTNEATPLERVKNAPYRYSKKKLVGTRDWTRVEVVSPVLAKGVAYVAVVLELNGEGSAWFDEVELKPMRE